MRDNLPVLLLALVVLGLCALFSILPGKPVTEKKTVEIPLGPADLKTLEKAAEALEQASYTQAFELLEPLSKKKDLQILVLNAESCSFLGKPLGVSLEELEKGVRKDRGLNLVFHLARVFEGSGKSEKALEYYMVLLAAKITPELRARVLKHAFELALATGDEKSAVIAFQGFVTAKSYDAAKMLALLQLLHSRKAQKDFDLYSNLAERQFPKNLELLRVLAKAAFGRGLRNDAQRLLEKIVTLDPTDQSAHFDLYTLHARAGRKGQALASLDRAFSGEVTFLPLASQAPLLFKIAMTTAKNGDLQPGYRLARRALTMNLRVLDQADETILKELFNEIKVSGTPEERAFHRVFDLYVNGDFATVEAALPDLEKQVSEPGLLRDFRNMSAFCRQILAKDHAFTQQEIELQRLRLAEQEALREQKRLARIPLPKPDQQTVPQTASPPVDGHLPPKKGTASQSKEILALREKLQQQSNDEGAMLAGGAKLLVLGDHDGAKEIFTAILQKKPGLPEACFQLGRVLRQEGDEGHAFDSVQQAINGNGREARFRGLLALLLADQKDWFRVEDEAKKAFALNPRNGEAHLAMLRRYAAAQDFTNAAKELKLTSQSSDPLVIMELEALKATLPAMKE